MKTAINWKPYFICAGILSIVVAVFNWKIAVGFVIGTIFNFINLFLSSKKFPRLDGKAKAVGSALAVMTLEGLITVGMAIGTYFIGGIPCFLAGFAGMILPNLYFFIVGSISK